MSGYTLVRLDCMGHQCIVDMYATCTDALMALFKYELMYNVGRPRKPMYMIVTRGHNELQYYQWKDGELVGPTGIVTALFETPVIYDTLRQHLEHEWFHLTQLMSCDVILENKKYAHAVRCPKWDRIDFTVLAQSMDFSTPTFAKCMTQVQVIRGWIQFYEKLGRTTCTCIDARFPVGRHNAWKY
jgi:hypothetical protein